MSEGQTVKIRSGVRALSDKEVAALIAKFEADGNPSAAESLRQITTRKLFGSKATVNWRDPEIAEHATATHTNV